MQPTDTGAHPAVTLGSGGCGQSFLLFLFVGLMFSELLWVKVQQRPGTWCGSHMWGCGVGCGTEWGRDASILGQIDWGSNPTWATLWLWWVRYHLPESWFFPVKNRAMVAAPSQRVGLRIKWENECERLGRWHFALLLSQC